jgi:hypothetical protein
MWILHLFAGDVQDAIAAFASGRGTAFERTLLDFAFSNTTIDVIAKAVQLFKRAPTKDLCFGIAERIHHTNGD